MWFSLCSSEEMIPDSSMIIVEYEYKFVARKLVFTSFVTEQ